MRQFMARRGKHAKPITGADRNPIQGDLSAVLDPVRAEKEDPRVERPAVMIKSLRYVGATEGSTPAEAMSAKSHALYEYLMSSAQLELKTVTEHRVSFADAQAFLSTPRADRVREYVEAINSTWVSYDFIDEDGSQRVGKRIQLLACEEVVRPSGDRFIAYSMHPSVRRVILEARQYAHLEIAAFARFRCKYSARLYPKLALVAGMTDQHLLSFKPEELAEVLGYVGKTPDKLHWGHFENDVLRPAMDDMFGALTDDGHESTAPAVRRFVANYEVRRAASRGRPVEAVVFYITKAKKHLGEEQKAPVVSIDRQKLREIFNASGLDNAEIPSDEVLRQAASRLNVTMIAVATRWAAAIRQAKSDPDILVGSLGILTGRQILDAIREVGIQDAVAKWVVDWKEPKGVEYRPGFKPAAPQPVAEPARVPFPEKLRVSFADASVIRIEFDDEVRTERWLRTEVLTWMKECQLFEFGEEKTLRFEWNGNGFVASKEITSLITPPALQALHSKFREYIDNWEFVR